VPVVPKFNPKNMNTRIDLKMTQLKVLILYFGILTPFIILRS